MQVWQLQQPFCKEPCLNFTLDSESLFCWYKWKKKDSNELWQQLKTMEMSRAWSGTYDDEGYSNLYPLTKSNSSSRTTEFKDIFPWKVSQIIIKTGPNQHENSHKLCDETGHSIVSLTESQWKLRQQHDQNFPMKGKPRYQDWKW